ncbi:MAG: adenylyl-sulfate kinase [Phycisphaerales bacterium]|nr:adenylyl-sulfate kinase [Phycisphaerales bacterium]
MAEATNIVWHAGQVMVEERQGISRVRPAIVWLTGLSGSGKSTLAMALEKPLVERGHLAFVLDGDNVRHGLNKNLGFSDADRRENIRRVGEVAKLFLSAGVMPITSFISPFRADRESVRALVGPREFIEIFVDAPIEVCEQRDPKGLYKKARAALAAGKGLQFTGIDSPYEPPRKPEIHLRTDLMAVEQCVKTVLAYLKDRGCLLA